MRIAPRQIRRTALAATLLLACAHTPAAEPTQNPAPDWPAAWFEPTEPLRIVGPVYYVGTRGLAAYLITTPAGHILVDGAMPQSATLIEDAIRKLNFRPEDIRLLLITHAHVDHVGTLAHFKKLSGAQLVVMAPEDELLASGGTKDYLYADAPAFHFDPVNADRVLR